MNNVDEYSTFDELIEARKIILARPFPQGYSGEEYAMMDKLETHCTEQLPRLLAAVKAKKAARFITWEQIYKHARDYMAEPMARATADYLKGRISFDRYCAAGE